VLLERARHGERRGAPDARQRVAADAGVRPHVSRQLARLRARVRTDAAAVRLLARVRATVYGQVAAVAEHLAAELARVVPTSTAAARRRSRRRRVTTTLRLPVDNCRNHGVRSASERA